MEFHSHIASVTKENAHWNIVIQDAFLDIDIMHVPFNTLPKNWKGVWKGTKLTGYGDINHSTNTLIITSVSLAIPTDPTNHKFFIKAFLANLGNKKEHMPLTNITNLSSQTIREIIKLKKLADEACDLLEEVQQNYAHLATYKHLKEAIDTYLSQSPNLSDYCFVRNTLSSVIIQACSKKLSFLELQSNPYHLDKTLSASEAFACVFGISRQIRAREAIKLMLRSRIMEHGHTCYPRHILINRLVADTYYDDLKDVSYIEESIDRDEELVHVAFQGTFFTYPSYLYHMEKDIAANLVRLQIASPKIPNRDKETLSSVISDYEAQNSCVLHNNQKTAIIRFLNSANIVTVTGFPGTGKSTLTSCLMHTIKILSPSIIIATCAPTGKAARRLPGGQGLTIHRLVGINVDNKAQFNQDNPIPADIIIVDECSMMDTTIAFRLFNAIATGCKVLLLGDVNQLPSVFHGDILRSIITSGDYVHTVKLSKIFRQMTTGDESGIVSLSKKIIRSQLPLESSDLNNNEVEWIDEDDQDTILEHIYRLYFQDIDDPPQILIPCKNTKTGVFVINNAIHQRLFPNNTQLQPFSDGERVICNINNVVTITRGQEEEINHDESYYNGDMGYITKARRGRSMVKMYDDNRHISIKNRHLEYSYAKTIHKSQGSEYNKVVIVLHKSHGIMLNKQLLYTAVTRAKKRLTIISSYPTLLKAITQSSVRRYTLLATFIEDHFQALQTCDQSIHNTHRM